MKCCTKCHEEKPLEAFGSAKRLPGGLNHWCRPCQSQASRESRNRMVEAEASLPPGTPKHCKRCGTTKTLADFYRGTYACSACVDVANERKREKERAEKEKIREAQRPMREAKKRERLISYRKRYYAANREKVVEKSRVYRSENLQKCRARELAYQKTEKGKMVAKNTTHRRRAAKREGTVTTEQLLTLKAKAKGRCYYCCRKSKNLTIDHIVPLAKGGRHDLDNLVMACGECNRRKSDKDPLAFANSLGVLLV